MRTKALILSAAVVAAGVASSMAQSNVYSLNIVGYVNVPIPAGFSIVSNPLDDGLNDGNVITSVIPATEDGTTVYLFKPSGGFADTENYIDGVGWIPGTNHIAPGVGFFVNATAATNITFVGQIAAGTYTNALAGHSFNLVGSVVPESLPLGSPGVTNTLQLQVSDNDVVYRYSKAKYNGYDIVTYINGLGWIDPAAPDGQGPANGPALNVGEGVFLNSTLGGNWVQTFTVN